ncbi:thiolase family protein [Candidatus Omnitrophota bacterium]
MSAKLENLVICDAVRTPFSHGTGLKKYSSIHLLELVIRALIERNRLKPDSVSGVVSGCIQQDTRATNIARIAGLRAGLSESSADYSVQANCNSGFVGLLSAIGGIAADVGGLYIVSGVESMSNYGFRLNDKTNKYGSVFEINDLLKTGGEEFLNNFGLVNCLIEGLTDDENDLSMIEIGEIMANCFSISREEQDKYTLGQLQKAVDAVTEGIFSKYTTPVGDMEKDAYPLNRKRLLKRPEQISRAAAVFGEENPELNPARFYEKHKKHLERLGIKKIIPSVTMYNSCIPGDGAGGCILTTEENARSLGLKPLLRIISWAAIGVDPVIMGIGPAAAAHKMFSEPKTKRAKGIDMDKLDIIEIHEAFASQVLSALKESENKYGIKFNTEKMNPYGGSLAYTHPLGATNFRLIIDVLTMFDKNSSAKYAMTCGCAGGGQGTSVLFERYK